MKVFEIKSVSGTPEKNIKIQVWFKRPGGHLMKLKKCAISDSAVFNEDGSVLAEFVFSPETFMQNFVIYHTKTKKNGAQKN